MRVAFQGEVGAFSEEAAAALYPKGQLEPLPTFEAVFDAVHHGQVEIGVVPIENSLHGSVHSNYDLLEEHELRIMGEVHLRVRHNLLGLPDSDVSTIRTVLSHPQALGQCRVFLKDKLPGADMRSAYDTAGAAKQVAAGGDRSVAAIASRQAGDHYGLKTLADGIESNHQNYTRFLALSRPVEDASGGCVSESERCKTSIVYSMKDNVPGALFKSLAVFALREIDLYKIESRPLIGSPGQYLFYLDFKGSESDEKVQKALGHLREIAGYVKMLGSYAMGGVIE